MLAKTRAWMKPILFGLCGRRRVDMGSQETSNLQLAWLKGAFRVLLVLVLKHRLLAQRMCGWVLSNSPCRPHSNPENGKISRQLLFNPGVRIYVLHSFISIYKHGPSCGPCFPFSSKECVWRIWAKRTAIALFATPPQRCQLILSDGQKVFAFFRHSWGSIWKMDAISLNEAYIVDVQGSTIQRWVTPATTSDHVRITENAPRHDQSHVHIAERDWWTSWSHPIDALVSSILLNTYPHSFFFVVSYSSLHFIRSKIYINLFSRTTKACLALTREPSSERCGQRI